MKGGLQDVRKTWEGWANAFAEKSFPSAAEARKRRKKWIGDCPASGATEPLGFRKKVEGCTGGEATRIKPFVFPTESYEVGIHSLQREN